MTQRPFTFITQVSVRTTASPEVVYDTIADLRAHLEWSGERASDDTFKLLALEASDDRAVEGTTFTSTGANFNGTFHDRSTVTVATRPNAFVIDTDARLDRKHGRPWEVHFTHRYDIESDPGGGARIVYTETIDRLNYVPYWLKAWIRPLSRSVIMKADTKQLENLAALAEERAV
jgi:Polyketide cyclase / dehydrase and lipid transport